MFSAAIAAAARVCDPPDELVDLMDDAQAVLGATTSAMFTHTHTHTNTRPMSNIVAPSHNKGKNCFNRDYFFDSSFVFPTDIFTM